MKLGLLTDIHERVEPLREALAWFRSMAVDQVVVIGDVVDFCLDLEETCSLLAEAGVIGVWGNHDIGLCVDPTPDARGELSSAVMEFMVTLKPRLEIGDCLFTHIEPWLDPESVDDLWYFEGTPDEHGQWNRIFNSTTKQFIFIGHYHKWLLATPQGLTDWRGESEIQLDAQTRYFIVIGGLCDGHAAIFDTESLCLIPRHLD